MKTEYKPEYTFDGLWNDLMEQVPVREDAEMSEKVRGHVYTTQGRYGDKVLEIVMSDMDRGHGRSRTVHIVDVDYIMADFGDAEWEYVYVVYEPGSDMAYGGVFKSRDVLPVVGCDEVKGADSVEFEKLLNRFKSLTGNKEIQWTGEPLVHLPKIMRWDKTEYDPKEMFDDLWNELMAKIPLERIGWKNKNLVTSVRLGKNGHKVLEVVLEQEGSFRAINVVVRDDETVDDAVVLYCVIVDEGKSSEDDESGLYAVAHKFLVYEPDYHGYYGAYGGTEEFSNLVSWVWDKALIEKYEWVDEPMLFLSGILRFKQDWKWLF